MSGINKDGKLENRNYTNRDMLSPYRMEFTKEIKSTKSLVPFGKYKGKTFNKYYKIDPDYFEKNIFTSQLVEISDEIKEQLRANNTEAKVVKKKISSEKIFKLISSLRAKGDPTKKEFKAYLESYGINAKRINTFWFLFGK